ncbi:MAG: hypothetical protein HOV77_33525 [Hamadaea sp.]|uniref:hypothetical protein n=1 Tax=Hamadaea sp. TaxID=2024425 RepID=UPI0017EEF438|nr:hypothetical protein [Hamadaea sp.]NUT24103.1 hypothetical protein [Hamadaea sp.]
MFGFGGTPKTRGQLAKEEFGTGWDHMVQAASHAAGGMGSAIGPRAHAMRSMVTPAAGRVRGLASSGWDTTVSTFSPLVAAAREGAREATEAALKEKAKLAKLAKREERMKQKRIGLAVGLLAAGVAVGAAAALVMRRRRRSTWEEYDPSQALDTAMESTSNALGKASDSMEKASDKVGDKMKSAGDKVGSMGRNAAEETRAMANDLTDTPSPSKNGVRRS